MLFRTNHGKLVEINKKDFINDKEYYKTISSCYGITFNEYTNHTNNVTSTNTFNYILSLAKK